MPLNRIQATVFSAIALASGSAFGQVGFEPGSGLPLEVDRRPWFNSPAVRDELGIESGQQELLNERYGELWKQYNKEYRFFDNNITEGEWRRHEGLRYEKFNTDFTRDLDKVITDSTARTRYDQLHRQYQGYDAFENPWLQKQLNLNADQQKQLRDYNKKWREDRARLRKSYPSDKDAAIRDAQLARRQMRERIDATLNPDQRETWRGLTGQTYEFPADLYVAPHPSP